MSGTKVKHAGALSLRTQLGENMRAPLLIIWLSGAAVLVFIIWAAVAWVDEIVRAQGALISSSRPQIIQNLEGGILAELAVAEGDIVAAGDVLGRLHSTQFQSAVDDFQDQIAAMDIRRLRRSWRASLILMRQSVWWDECRGSWPRNARCWLRGSLIMSAAAKAHSGYWIRPPKSASCLRICSTATFWH